MRTETKNIYKFDELSEDAQKKAIEKYSSQTIEHGFNWTDEYIQTVKEGLKAFNADLVNYSIDCLSVNQSSWKIKVDSDINEEMNGIRLRTYILNNFSHVLYERKPYGKYEIRAGKWGYPYYSKCQKRNTECPLTGCSMDYDFLENIYKFIEKPDSSTFAELLEDATQNTFKALKNDCEHQLTDEYIKDAITSNEYEFYEDGTIV